jgi:CHAT domain-containing protein
MEIAEALRRAQLWLRDVTAGELADRFTSERETIMSSNRMSIEVVTEQFRRFATLDPGECPFAHPYYWAAFTFNGA